MRTCPACGEAKPDTDFNRSTRAKSGLQTYCKPCHLEKDDANPELRSARYRRYKAKWPAKTTWAFVVKRAQKMGVPFMATEQFVSWYDKQSRICTYCGIDEAEAKQKFDHNLHIDRKENSLGYVENNIVLACHRCNVVKNAYLTHDQMKQVAGMFFGGPVNNHDKLVQALEQCGAPFSTPPGSVAQCQAAISAEFQRRMDVAADALMRCTDLVSGSDTPE